jgi:hypothetical protein
MEAYRIERFGSVDGIGLRSSEDRRPGLREILMRVRASSLNYRDLMVLKGGGRGPTKIGVVPLSDGAGEVEAIGEGVTRVKIGDRVADSDEVARRSEMMSPGWRAPCWWSFLASCKLVVNPLQLIWSACASGCRRRDRCGGRCE